MQRLLRKPVALLFYAFIFCLNLSSCQSRNKYESRMDLSGEWAFQIDSLDIGVQQSWFSKNLQDKIQLPGSMTTNGKGNDITLETPWTGSIWDSSFFNNEEYTKYRQPGNIKVPFWLQPVKYYKGAAWYQKEVNIPAFWEDKYLELFIERSHWETTVWINDQQIGMQNSLGTPHIFNLTGKLTPGTHQLTVRVDNRIKDFNVGINSHSITDHTQTNWNGMVGDLFIAARPAVHIDDIQLYPDINNKQVVAKVKINNITRNATDASIQFIAESTNPKAEKLKPLSKEIEIQGNSIDVEVIYPMGDTPLLWDEFNPNLYSMQVSLTSNKSKDEKTIVFGMREFSTQGTVFTINGTPTFLRGTMEGAIFPKTGYPPTDVEEWSRIF